MCDLVYGDILGLVKGEKQKLLCLKRYLGFNPLKL